MFVFTKDETLLAAKQFCYALEIWATSFTGTYSDIPEREINNEMYSLDKKTDARLSESIFVCNISRIYDFAKTGAWEGEYIFDDSDYLENELVDPLTELSAFSEIFKYEHVNFHDNSGEELMSVSVAGSSIKDILSDVISAAFARFSLITHTSIKLDDLAMLGGVSLKTVRNAVSSKGHDRIVLSETTINGKPCVDAEEALRWLQTKKAYTGPSFINETPSYRNYQTLGQFQHHCLSLMKKAEIDWSDIQKKCSWGTDVFSAFKSVLNLKIDDGVSELAPENLKTFGQICNVDDLELFVKEGFKVIASTLAEYQASKLFN